MKCIYLNNQELIILISVVSNNHLNNNSNHKLVNLYKLLESMKILKALCLILIWLNFGGIYTLIF